MKRSHFLVLALISSLILAAASCEWITSGESREDTDIDMPGITLSKETDAMFTGNEDHTIAISSAKAMMTAFQENNPFDTYAWYFSRKAVEQLLEQEGCVGIRIYGGLKEDGKFSPVMFGVNAHGSDIKTRGLSKALIDSVGPMEFVLPCPPYCDPCPDC
jgi:hypothetical protein